MFGNNQFNTLKKFFLNIPEDIEKKKNNPEQNKELQGFSKKGVQYTLKNLHPGAKTTSEC